LRTRATIGDELPNGTHRPVLRAATALAALTFGTLHVVSVNLWVPKNSSGHAEQAFRATSSDPSRCRVSAPSSLEPDERADR
jgi:hypothetical protein